MRLHRAHLLAGLLSATIHVAIAKQADATTAQPTAPIPPSDAQRVEVTGTTEGADMNDSTATRMVMPRVELSKFGDSRLSDALQRVTGVHVETSAGRPVVRVRGLGDGYTQVLLNGEPTRPDFSIDSIPVAMVDRVEILRVGTVDMRMAGIAGTINIVLRQTPRTLRREIKANISTQRAHPSEVIDGFFGDSHGDLAYSIGVVVAKTTNEQPSAYDQSFTTSQGELQSARHIDRRELNQTGSITLSPHLTWKPREGETLRMENLVRLQRYDGIATDDRASSLGNPPDLDRDRLDAQSDTQALSTRLAWTRALGDGRRVDARFSASRSRRQADSVLYGFDKPPGRSFVQVLARRVRSLAIDDSALLSGSYRVPLAASQVAVGWDAEHTQRDEDRIQRETTSPDRTPQDLDESYTASIQRVAVYLQNEWEASSATSVYFGVRWEGMRTRSTGKSVEGTTVASDVLSPVVEARWNLPASKDKFRISLGRSYKAPTTMELLARRWVVADNSPTTPNFQGNPHLKPELSWGLDLSLEHPWATAGITTATVFGKRIDNVIQRNVSAIDGVWVQQPVNRGRATVQGIELDTRINVGKLWQGAPALDIRLNAMRAWSQVDTVPAPNNRLDRQRPYSAGIGLDYRLTRPDVTLGTSLGVVGGSWSRSSNTVSAYAPPERRAEAYATWRPGAGPQIRLAVSRKTRGSRSLAEDLYVDDLGSFHQTTYEPGVTTWRIGVEWNL